MENRKAKLQLSTFLERAPPVNIRPDSHVKKKNKDFDPFPNPSTS